MSVTTAGPAPGLASSALARDRLGAGSVSFFVLSAAAPLTVVAGVVTTGYAQTGMTAIPAAFLAVGVVLALFMPGYLAMSRAIPNAGAFYAYTAAGLGRVPAVGVAWLAIAAYCAVQLAVYGAIGAAVSPLLVAWFGWNTSWWTIALVCWALVAVLGVRRIDVSGRILAVLGAAEVAVILVFNVADLLPASHRGVAVSFEGFNPSGLLTTAAGPLLVLATLSYAGVEQAPVFVEEARNAARTLRRATYASVAAITAVYAVSAWAMTVPLGPARTIEAAGQLGPELVFGHAATQLGPVWSQIGHALFATSLAAAGLSFHNTCARYAFALGREKVLPAMFGRASRRAGAPKAASIAQTVIGLVVIVAYAAGGLDPMTAMFYPLGTAGGFGILVLLAVTSLAVIGYFARPAHRGGVTVWGRLIAPTIAAVALWIMVGLALMNFAAVLGVDSRSPLRWIVPAAVAALAMAGCAWGLILRRRRPEIFRLIGQGANSALAAKPAEALAPGHFEN